MNAKHIFLACLHVYFSKLVLGSGTWPLLSNTQKRFRIMSQRFHFGSAPRGGPVAVPKIPTVLGSVGRLHLQAGWT